jgi:hypothetical protein
VIFLPNPSFPIYVLSLKIIATLPHYQLTPKYRTQYQELMAEQERSIPAVVGPLMILWRCAKLVCITEH